MDEWRRRGYLISCSRFRNSGQSKNSDRVISGPPQIFLMVTTVALSFRLLTMLFRLDCMTPLMAARRLMVMLVIVKEGLHLI